MFNARHRSPAGADRALRERRPTWPRRCATRASPALRRDGARRRALAGRVRDRRRRADDRPPAHGRGRRRPGAPPPARAGRRHLARDRCRHAGPRPGGDRRAHPVGRRRRVHARIRARAGWSASSASPPTRCARRASSRPPASRSSASAGRASRPVLGAARRRSRLRHRRRARVRARARRAEVVGGMLGWPAERAPEVAAAYAALMAGAPDDLGGGLALLDAPPAPFVPPALQGAPIVAVLALVDRRARGRRAALRPLRELAPAFDAVAPAALRRAAGDVRAARRGAGADALAGRGRLPRRAACRGGGRHRGGRRRAAFAARIDPAAAAGRRLRARARGGDAARAPGRRLDAGRPATAWLEPADDERSRAWTGRRAAARWLRGRGARRYPNFIPDADPARLQAAYAPAVWERLRAIRAGGIPRACSERVTRSRCLERSRTSTAAPRFGLGGADAGRRSRRGHAADVRDVGRPANRRARTSTLLDAAVDVRRRESPRPIRHPWETHVGSPRNPPARRHQALRRHHRRRRPRPRRGGGHLRRSARPERRRQVDDDEDAHRAGDGRRGRDPGARVRGARATPSRRARCAASCPSSTTSTSS